MSNANAQEITINSQWATTVGEVCDRFGGEVQTGPFGSQLHASDYSDVGTPVVMPQDIQDGRIVCDRIARVGPKHVDLLGRHILRTGDLVFSRRGDVSRFAVVTGAEEGWLCGTGSIRVRLNSPDVDAGYARRYFQQEVVGKWLRHHAKGVTMPNLNTTIIRALPFAYPPLEEQRRIAEVLDRAEALRAKRRAALAHLDTLTQSIFLDVFGDPSNNPKKFPAASLGKIVEFVGGSQPPRSTFTYEPSPDTIRLVQIRDFKSDDFKTYIPRALARRFLDEDDVMIGRYGPPVFQILRGLSGSYNVALMKAVPRRGVTKDFIFHLLQEPRLHSYVVARSERTAGQTGVNLDLLENYPAYLPPLGIQEAFGRQASAVEKLKSAHRASLAKLDELFASLQHRAFRGEL